MKKSQLTSMSFVYIIITIVAIAILIFGYMQLRDINKSADKVALINFERSLGKSLEKQTLLSFGSVTEKVFSLPSDIEKVCFVDNSQEFNDFVDKELALEREKYSGYNLFLGRGYMPAKLNYFVLDESPLCVKAANGKIKLRLESKGKAALVSAADISDKKVECVNVFFNNNPDKAVDVVFLGSGYNNIEEFGNDVNNYIAGFTAVEPFLSNIDKVNFYRIDIFKDIGCEIKSYGLGSYVICDDYLAKQLASDCPDDYVIVLVSVGRFTDLVRNTRSSAKGNFISLNALDNELILLHEFGHSFANLADEYVDNNYYSQLGFDEEDYANCDSRPCNEWSLITEDCIQGCSLSAYYRPTIDSIMNSARVNDYGPVNENEIQKRLDVYES